MIKGPKLKGPKLKWGDRTAARVDEVEYLTGIRVVGYTSLKGVTIVEVHGSVADGAYHKYKKLKDTVHEES